MVDKPLFQYAVEDMYHRKLDHDFVTDRTKRNVEDHFDAAYELETELEVAG